VGTFGALRAHFYDQKMVWDTKHIPKWPQEAPPWFRPHLLYDFSEAFFGIFLIFSASQPASQPAGHHLVMVMYESWLLECNLALHVKVAERYRHT